MNRSRRIAGALACSLSVLLWLAPGDAAVVVDDQASTQPPAKTPAPSESERVRGFSVTLVLGEMQGAATPDNLPPGAKKALDDMRSFLPYKSFRLLDTQWILCCATGGFADLEATAVAGRLRGVDEQEYQFSVTILNMSGPQLSVRFLMNPAGSSLKKISPLTLPDRALGPAVSESRGLERAMIENRLIEMRREVRAIQEQAARQKLAPEAAAASKAQVEQLERQLSELTPVAAGKGAVIDSTFSMDIGETVVIGTSSLKGEKALIALLTAAPRAGRTSIK
jgi:hypothetical protein